MIHCAMPGAAASRARTCSPRDHDIFNPHIKVLATPQTKKLLFSINHMSSFYFLDSHGVIFV
jgi:hypothetical protein